MERHNYFFLLKYLDTEFHFNIESACLNNIEIIFDFFKSHFLITSRVGEKPDITFFVKPYSKFYKKDYNGLNFEPVVIRKSSADAFNIYGCKAVINDGVTEIIHSTNTKTAIVLEKNQEVITLYISEYSRIQVIEFIRDLIIKLEEKRGTLILHAAAVEYQGRGIAIVGSKGAGKSTLMLEMISKFGYNLLSGDKLFLRVKDSSIMAFGWPDYPHMGYGTILGHNSLKLDLEKMGFNIDPSTPQMKILFPPDILKSALKFEYASGPALLNTIIFPDVLRGEDITIKLLSNTEKDKVLHNLEFSSCNSYSTWHSFIKNINKEELIPYIKHLSKALKSCRFYSLKGKGRLTKGHLEVLGC